MKLSDISPSPPYKGSKRTHYKSADRGGYNWDNGFAAFGDPLEMVGKASRARKKAAVTWRAKKQTGGDKARNNYHRKHG
jgi:hypothetical protein